MPLIFCPECSKQVSSVASQCPHCGYPLAKGSGDSATGSTGLPRTSTPIAQPTHIVIHQPAKEFKGLARASWILIFLVCGLAVVPFIGFGTWLIAGPVLLVTFILSIMVLSRGGTLPGILILFTSIIVAPIFIAFAPFISSLLGLASIGASIKGSEHHRDQTAVHSEQRVMPIPTSSKKKETLVNPMIRPLDMSNLAFGQSGHWVFENGSLKDCSAHGLDGINKSVRSTSNQNGHAGALMFDGRSSSVEIRKTFAMENQQTVVAWVKPASISNRNAIVEKAIEGYGGEVDFALYLQSDGRVCWDVVSDDGSTGVFCMAISDRSLPFAHWSCVAGVIDRSNNEVRLYIDGVLEGASSMDGRSVRNRNRPFRIGRKIGNQGPGYFQGAIGEVGIWARTLSQDEITGLSLSIH